MYFFMSTSVIQGIEEVLPVVDFIGVSVFFEAGNTLIVFVELVMGLTFCWAKPVKTNADEMSSNDKLRDVELFVFLMRFRI